MTHGVLTKGSPSPCPEKTLTIGGLSEYGEFHELPIELLQMIIKKLYPWDVWEFRGVNSVWRNLTSHYLREEGPMLPLVSISMEDPIHHCQYPHLTLDTLNECLESAQNLGTLDQFPSHSFRLHGVNLCGPTIQKFLTLYGPTLKCLSLDACASLCEQNELTVLRRLLVEQAPNLQQFSMHNHWTMLNTTSSLPPLGARVIVIGSIGMGSDPTQGGTILFPPNSTVQLPNLRKLGFGLTTTDQRTLEQILEVAPNLNWCQFWTYGPFFDLDRFQLTNKIHTIKSMTLNLVPYKFDFFEKMADLGVQLTSLEFALEYVWDMRQDLRLMKRVAGIINKILESSKFSLRKIKEFQPLGYIPGIQVPQTFYNLETLQLTNNFFEIPDNVLMYESIFPANKKINFNETFPKLKNVRLSFIKVDEGEMAGNEFWAKYFPFNSPQNCFKNVHKVRTHSLRENYYEGLAALFPNLTHLEIDKYGPEVRQLCSEIFIHLKSLKSLIVTGINMAKFENHFPALDSILTGFSPEYCRLLATEGHKVALESERVMPSILDLKDLRYLHLHFYHDDYSYDDIIVQPMEPHDGEPEVEEEEIEEDVQAQIDQDEQQALDDLDDLEIEIPNGDHLVRMARWSEPVLSQVVGHHCFKLRPKLRVKITLAESIEREIVHAKAALDEISPFVDSAKIVPDILKLIS